MPQTPTFHFEFVQYPVGQETVSAYLARPEGAGPFPAIAVVMEWWGLDPHIMDVAARFAREGYLAIAPDIYHGRVTHNPEVASQWSGALDYPRAVREVGEAVRFLKARPDSNGKAATIGYCMGGGVSLQTGCATPEVDAVISYYGPNPTPIDRIADIRGAILAVYGEDDAWLFPAHRDALREAAQRLGKQVEVHSYAGAPHGFFNETNRVMHRPEAARDAWQKTIDFLARALR